MSKNNAAPRELKPVSPRRRLWALGVLSALVLGLIVGVYSGRHLALDDAVRHYRQLQSQLDLTVAQNYQDINATQARLDALEGQLAVEQSTRKSLEVSLEQTQAQLSSARERLAFFDRLLPPGPAGSISIRALDIEPRGPHLVYKVLLTRNALNEGAFEGRLQFMAHGQQDGKAANIQLEPPKVDPSGLTPLSQPASDPFLVGFEQFQRSEGLLSLPPDFQAETITLNVLEGDTVRVSRRINLPATD